MTKFEGRNQSNRKSYNTKYGDGQSNWIRNLTGENEALSHLYEPIKKWQPPKKSKRKGRR